MPEIIKNSIQYISTKFPSVFLKYLRKQLKVSDLKNSSLYDITKVAHTATSLDELYKSIHEISFITSTLNVWNKIIKYLMKSNERGLTK